MPPSNASGVATTAEAQTSSASPGRRATVDVTAPPPASPADAPAAHAISVTREALLAGPPDTVFAFIAAEDVLPQLLTGYGPLPAVTHTDGQTGAWDAPGSTRIVHLADGSTVREQVTACAAPDCFAYRVWDFGHPLLKALAIDARGTWLFQAAAGATLVRWTYTFRARNRLAAPALWLIARGLWRGYMDVCLNNAMRRLALLHDSDRPASNGNVAGAGAATSPDRWSSPPRVLPLQDVPR